MQGMPLRFSRFTFHVSFAIFKPQLRIFATDCKSFISLCSSDCILQKARTKAEPIIDLPYPNLHWTLILLQYQAFVIVVSHA